ncbi:MAG: tRNA 4-thiouridine(8) synthase ThiI [Firmicutes bacterium HGW-Firmicutes-9]|jgi:thiamine biosynthesis protein ThiI|nr:MAG: tRNA 4-thiouridine(8) synthase ThiI [Firmicutes bacterium HGW-Firmicutes-9]
MEAVMLVRYAEIHLKGLNRPYFERSLMKRITLALRPLRVKVVREQGRVFVFGIPVESMNESADKLTRVFGIHSVSPALAVEKDWDQMVEAAKVLVARRIEGLPQASFKVIARRADKRFAMRSQDICRTLGGLLLEAFPVLRVDVHQPDFYVGVEVRQEQAFLFAEEKLGAGGMPVGTNGHAMLLISGGIDSPVAGHMIAKRGVRISAVHFYSYPYTSERAREKVVDLTKILASYAGEVDLYLVPFTEIQLAIYEKCPKSETTVLMRRLMMQIAERIARSCGAQALVTGESIGQVASQTIESLTVTNDAVDLPVFRPLIGFDKEEIVTRAKAMGSFETSILPFEDCCTVFVPQHPVTRPKLEDIRASEARLDFTEMIETAIANTEHMTVE